MSSRSASSSRSRVWRRCSPRRPEPVLASGCFRSASSARGGHRRADEVGDLAQEPTRRRQRQRSAGAVVGFDPPPVERGGRPAGSSVRSGVISAAACPVVDRLAQDRARWRPLRLAGSAPRSGSSPGRAAVRPSSRGPSRQPLVGHRGGPQRQRDKRDCAREWAGRRRPTTAPRCSGPVPSVSAAGQSGIVGDPRRAARRRAKLVPDTLRLSKSIARQDHRALRQPCDRSPSAAASRRAIRSSRPRSPALPAGCAPSDPTSRSITRRCRASTSGGSPRRRRKSARRCRETRGCAPNGRTGRSHRARAMASGSTPSPCISSTRLARLSASP